MAGSLDGQGAVTENTKFQVDGNSTQALEKRTTTQTSQACKCLLHNRRKRSSGAGGVFRPKFYPVRIHHLKSILRETYDQDNL